MVNLMTFPTDIFIVIRKIMSSKIIVINIQCSDHFMSSGNLQNARDNMQLSSAIISQVWAPTLTM